MTQFHQGTTGTSNRGISNSPKRSVCVMAFRPTRRERLEAVRQARAALSLMLGTPTTAHGPKETTTDARCPRDRSRRLPVGMAGTETMTPTCVHPTERYLCKLLTGRDF